jgi:hypothetical protein
MSFGARFQHRTIWDIIHGPALELLLLLLLLSSQSRVRRAQQVTADAAAAFIYNTSTIRAQKLGSCHFVVVVVVVVVVVCGKPHYCRFCCHFVFKGKRTESHRPHETYIEMFELRFFVYVGTG